MRLLPGLIGILAATFLCLASQSASAQATRTWVSGVGDDANPCSRTAPCKTFAGAISKTAAGGEINVLDPGGFGAVTITKSITISSEGFEAGVLVAGTNAIIINAASTDVVVLRGLDIQGLGSGLAGVKLLSGGALRIEKCVIRGFRGGTAIGVAVISTTNTEVSIVDTVISENGSSTTAGGGGVVIAPGSAAVSHDITISRSQIDNNFSGVVANTNNGGTIRVAITDSTTSGNTNAGVQGIGAQTRIALDRATVNGNANGVASQFQANVTVNNSLVSMNVWGLFIANNGNLVSFGNNQLIGNTTADGAFTATVPQK